jgi:hypothetical protein
MSVEAFISTSGWVRPGTELALKTRQKYLRLCFAAGADIAMQHVDILGININVVNNF